MGSIFRLFLTFGKLELQYSYKLHSYKKIVLYVHMHHPQKSASILNLEDLETPFEFESPFREVNLQYREE